MALEYKAHKKFEALAPILEDYAVWFGDIAYRVAYAENFDANIPLMMTPKSFQSWLELPDTKNELSSFMLRDITKAHEDMVRIGAQIVSTLKNNQKPSQKEFEDFKNLYSSFLVKLRRVEKESTNQVSGIDPETGLRSMAVMMDDLKEEMERLGRHGNPFCLVQCRIDFFAKQQDQNRAVKLVSDNIKECMRSFDDAYYQGQGQFLLSLKHADKIGGKAAINRLQQLLQKDKENQQSMTLSFSYSEPSVGEDIAALLGNMRQDLIDNMNDANIVLELTEISALERYAAQHQG